MNNEEMVPSLPNGAQSLVVKQSWDNSLQCSVMPVSRTVPGTYKHSLFVE